MGVETYPSLPERLGQSAGLAWPLAVQGTLPSPSLTVVTRICVIALDSMNATPVTCS